MAHDERNPLGYAFMKFLRQKILDGDLSVSDACFIALDVAAYFCAVGAKEGHVESAARSLANYIALVAVNMREEKDLMALRELLVKADKVGDMEEKKVH